MYLALLHFVSNKMNVNLNVFSALMMNRITGHVNSTNVVTVDDRGPRRMGTQFKKKVLEPTNFSNYIGYPLYSASTLNQEIVVCHFEDQEIRFSLR